MAALAILLSVSAHSEPVQIQISPDAKSDPYFQIGAIHVSNVKVIKEDTDLQTPDVSNSKAGTLSTQTVVTPPRKGATPVPSPGFGTGTGGGKFLGDLGGVIGSIPKDSQEGALGIADILIKVWDIIEDNQPVVDINTKSAAALPNIAQSDWTKLTGWKTPRSVEFELDIQNLYGMHVVHTKYKVTNQYGGNIKGKGKYIASTQVLPTLVSVLWGFNLKETVDVISVVNAGTEANPTAEVTLSVTQTWGNPFTSQTSSTRYMVTGDGQIENLETGEQYF